MTIIDFLSNTIGSTDNLVLFSLASFMAMFITIDFIHVFFTAVFSWFKK